MAPLGGAARAVARTRIEHGSRLASPSQSYTPSNMERLFLYSPGSLIRVGCGYALGFSFYGLGPGAVTLIADLEVERSLSLHFTEVCSTLYSWALGSR